MAITTKLSQTKIDKFIAERKKDGLNTRKLGDGGGLYLQWRDGASWIFRWKKNGTESSIGLGALASVSLSAARAEAAQCRAIVAQGRDPKVARDSIVSKGVKTFDQCEQECWAIHKHSLKGKTVHQRWENSIATHVSPILGRIPVNEADVNHVLRVLQPIWLTVPTTATQVRGRIEKVFNFALAKGYREFSKGNPAAWDVLKTILPSYEKIASVQHFRAIEKVPAFVQKLRLRDAGEGVQGQSQWGLSARALEFLILTVCRTGDIIGQDDEAEDRDRPPLMWQHLDLKKHVWHKPKTKTGLPHSVPLSEPAMRILLDTQALEIPGPLVFPSLQKPGFPLGKGAMLEVAKSVSGDPDMTCHGFRSCFEDWCGDETDFPDRVINAAMMHGIVKGKVKKGYRRRDAFDARVPLMQAWGEYCDSGRAAKILKFG